MKIDLYSLYRLLTEKVIAILLITFLGGCSNSGSDNQDNPQQNTPLPIPAISIETFATGLAAPVQVTHAGDGSERLFVVEQRGTLRIVIEGKLIDPLFLDIRNKVNMDGEMGFLGVAFHPNFINNGRFFVNYVTINSFGCSLALPCTIISEFTVSSQQPVLEDTEFLILKIGQPKDRHNGGQLLFGPDSYLYIGMGDGGIHANAQDLSTLLGGLLRIDIDSGLPYTIPPDNPEWPNVQDARREIWAYGFRNPWRFSFDPVNGDIYLGDVGEAKVEEIDIVLKGLNYGWDQVEGDICFKPNCDLNAFEPPIAVHTHDEGWVSITGGVVYRGQDVENLQGVYLYGDWVTGDIYGLRYDGSAVITSPQKLTSIGDFSLSSFGYDENNEVYALDHGNSTMYKIVAP